MASEVDICNIALAHIGDSANVASIKPPDGSVQAEHCARFYPIARDSLLEMHDWGFATKRGLLAQLSNTSNQWAFCYAAPTDLVQVISVIDYYASDDSNAAAQGTIGSVSAPQPYSRESAPDGTRVIYTNQANALLRYTARIADTTQFSPLFTQCLARFLASMVAGPIIKGDAGASESMRQQVLAFGRDGKSGIFGVATASDANQKNSNARERHQAPWITAR